jgi:pyruvate dehydrogenase E2 component (dihydrolipoamide acetyltransferase)
VVALVAEPGEAPSAQEIDAKIAEINIRESKREPTAQSASQVLMAETRETAAKNKHVRASPAARRLMRENKIDPGSIIGSGRGSTITANDVILAIQKSCPQGLRVVSTLELTGTRLTIARKLTQSHNEAVHVTLMADVDATYMYELKKKHSSDTPSPSFTELLIPMVARALRLHPEVNAIFEDNQIKIVDNVNVAVAVDTPNGLKVPVIRDADKLVLPDIVTRLRKVTEAAKKGQLTIEDMSSGTFTITNLGMFGIEGFTPIINPPQCATLGVGAVIEKPVVAEGQVAVRKVMTLSLSFDHRVMDGVTAAKFLSSLKTIISNDEGRVV